MINRVTQSAHPNSLDARLMRPVWSGDHEGSHSHLRQPKVNTKITIEGPDGDLNLEDILPHLNGNFVQLHSIPEDDGGISLSKTGSPTSEIKDILPNDELQLPKEIKRANSDPFPWMQHSVMFRHGLRRSRSLTDVEEMSKLQFDFLDLSEIIQGESNDDRITNSTEIDDDFADKRRHTITNADSLQFMTQLVDLEGRSLSQDDLYVLKDKIFALDSIIKKKPNHLQKVIHMADNMHKKIEHEEKKEKKLRKSSSTEHKHFTIFVYRGASETDLDSSFASESFRRQVSFIPEMAEDKTDKIQSLEHKTTNNQTANGTTKTTFVPTVAEHVLIDGFKFSETHRNSIPEIKKSPKKIEAIRKVSSGSARIEPSKIVKDETEDFMKINKVVTFQTLQRETYLLGTNRVPTDAKPEVMRGATEGSFVDKDTNVSAFIVLKQFKKDEILPTVDVETPELVSSFRPEPMTAIVHPQTEQRQESFKFEDSSQKPISASKKNYEVNSSDNAPNITITSIREEYVLKTLNENVADSGKPQVDQVFSVNEIPRRSSDYSIRSLDRSREWSFPPKTSTPVNRTQISSRSLERTPTQNPIQTNPRPPPSKVQLEAFCSTVAEPRNAKPRSTKETKISDDSQPEITESDINPEDVKTVESDAGIRKRYLDSISTDNIQDLLPKKRSNKPKTKLVKPNTLDRATSAILLAVSKNEITQTDFDNVMSQVSSKREEAHKYSPKPYKEDGSTQTIAWRGIVRSNTVVKKDFESKKTQTHKFNPNQMVVQEVPKKESNEKNVGTDSTETRDTGVAVNITPAKANQKTQTEKLNKSSLEYVDDQVGRPLKTGPVYEGQKRAPLQKDFTHNATFQSIRLMMSPNMLEEMQGLDQLQRECLLSHNIFRVRHRSPPVQWNEDLAKQAQRWASYLVSSNTLQHSDEQGYSENVIKKHIRSMESARGFGIVQQWYKGGKDYDYSAGCRQRFGRALQGFIKLVWLDIEDVGIGYAFDQNDNIIVVCHYKPKISIRNIESNVLPKV